MKLADIPAPVWQLAAVVAGGALLLWWLKRGAAAAAAAVNPLNHDNIFAASVNAAGETITGQPYSLGAAFYNFFHEDEFERSEREHRARLAAAGKG